MFSSYTAHITQIIEMVAYNLFVCFILRSILIDIGMRDYVISGHAVPSLLFSYSAIALLKFLDTRRLSNIDDISILPFVIFSIQQQYWHKILSAKIHQLAIFIYWRFVILSSLSAYSSTCNPHYLYKLCNISKHPLESQYRVLFLFLK